MAYQDMEKFSKKTSAMYRIIYVGWGGEHKGEQKEAGQEDLTLIVRQIIPAIGPLLELKEKEIGLLFNFIGTLCLAKIFSRLYSESKEAWFVYWKYNMAYKDKIIFQLWLPNMINDSKFLLVVISIYFSKFQRTFLKYLI